MREQLIRLPDEPGTVIAIGEWWLVRLPPYETGAKSWELLPFRSKAVAELAERLGVKSQCVYGDEWVLAEVEQEGGYEVVAEPVRRYGVRYVAADAERGRGMTDIREHGRVLPNEANST